MANRFQFRRDLASTWASVNPLLASGELCLETDTKKLKIGDGIHRWNQLEYVNDTEEIESKLTEIGQDVSKLVGGSTTQIVEVEAKQNKDGYFVNASGAFTSNASFYSKEFDCEEGKKYYISGSTGSGNASCLAAWFGADGFISNIYPTSSSANRNIVKEREVVTSPDGATYVRIEALKETMATPKLEVDQTTTTGGTIGNVNNLTTTAKDNLVNAINEVASKEVDAYTKSQTDAKISTLSARVDELAGGNVEKTYTLADCTIVGKGINSTTGAESAYSGWNASDYIDIESNAVLTYPYSSQSFGLAFYDSNKTYISGVKYASQSNATINKPANAKYIRFCSATTASAFAIKFTTYIENNVEEQIEDLNDSVEALNTNIGTINDAIGKNTKKSVTYGYEQCTIDGYGIRYANGVPTAYQDWKLSDYIKIASNVTLTYPATSTLFGIAFFDKDKVYISGAKYSSQSSANVALPTNAVYVRFCCAAAKSSEFVIKFDTLVDGELVTEITDIKADLANKSTSINVCQNAIGKAFNEPAKMCARPLKILAIGNSWTLNSTAYLVDILSNLGVQSEVHRTFLGSASLESYDSNTRSGASSFQHTYKTSNMSSYATIGTQSIETIIMSDEWDIITFQQDSGHAGIESSWHPYIERLLTWARAKKDIWSKIYLHATWAYPTNCTHTDFANYNNDSETMYNAVLSAVNDVSVSTGIKAIIPNTPNIQQAKSEYGDDQTFFTFASDGGKHLEAIGQYSAACVWAETIMKKFIRPHWNNKSITDCTYNASFDATMCSKFKQIAHDVVANITTYFPNAE